MLKIAIENYRVSRKKCLSPVDPHVEDLSTSSMSCFSYFSRAAEPQSLMNRSERNRASNQNLTHAILNFSRSAGGSFCETRIKVVTIPKLSVLVITPGHLFHRSMALMLIAADVSLMVRMTPFLALTFATVPRNSSRPFRVPCTAVNLGRNLRRRSLLGS